MEEKTPIISFRNADIVNGEATVIYGMDMDIYPGDFVYIVGKVGTGKTSIIRTMIAETPLTQGHGEVCGYLLEDISEKDIPYLRRKLGVVFQDFQLGLLIDVQTHENAELLMRACLHCQEEVDSLHAQAAEISKRLTLRKQYEEHIARMEQKIKDMRIYLEETKEDESRFGSYMN